MKKNTETLFCIVKEVSQIKLFACGGGYYYCYGIVSSPFFVHFCMQSNLTPWCPTFVLP